MCRSLLALVFLTAPAFAQKIQQVIVAPFDFQSEETGLLIKGLSQIESNGRHLFLRDGQTTEILEIDLDGRLVRRIGGTGGHPAEFGHVGVMAMAVEGTELWAIDMELKRVRKFVDGTYASSFPLQSYNISNGATLANNFAFGNDLLVLPAAAETEKLAAVYGTDGTLVEHIGEQLAFPHLSKHILGMNDTHWLRHGSGWVSVHKFFPLVTVYDSSFSVLEQMQVESGVITDVVDRTNTYDPGTAYTLPAPVFTDAKIFRDNLYLLCKGRLHQVDLNTMELASITVFKGQGPAFKDVPDGILSFFYLAFEHSGRLVLGHPGLLWNHDLWRANLPGLTQAVR